MDNNSEDNSTELTWDIVDVPNLEEVLSNVLDEIKIHGKSAVEVTIENEKLIFKNKRVEV